MTYWEAFTQAKDKDNPDSNEDRIVIVPDRLYAVIDGATDKSGLTHDGLTGGQIAGRILEDALREAARSLEGPEGVQIAAILDRVNRALARRYRELGIGQAVGEDPWRRFSAQVAIAVRHRTTYRFIVIGDTGLRIDGREVFCVPNPGDVICAQIRVAVHRFLTKSGADTEMARTWARRYTVEGLGSVLPGTPIDIGTAELRRFRNLAKTESRKRLAGLAARDIDGVLMEGLKGLHRFRNRPGPLGFASIDGTRVPPEMIVEFERAAKDVQSIELFSDGFPRLPGKTTVADWEADFLDLEQDDPERVDICPETKGSTPDKFADDRTVLIVRPSAQTGK